MLLCAAMPFGYGPSAKLITLAESLRDDWRLVFIGQGTALELASRASDVFDRVVPARATDPSALRLASQAWGVLSLMDRDAGVLAARTAKPLFVVDSLLWMRRVVPEPLRHAELYWAQGFPGLSPKEYEPQPAVVGPIVTKPRAGRIGQREGLVVNLGGSAAPDGRRSLYEGYARFVVRALLDAGLPGRFRRVTVMGGAGVIASLEDIPHDSRVCLASVSHAEASDRMARAAAVLTAPGLTTTLQCFCDRTPTFFLPPQNYSQWCILRHLRAKRIAGDALHWEELETVPHLEERMLPEDRDPIVCETIGRLSGDAGAAELLRSRLVRVAAEPRDLVEAQAAFFASLGPRGVETIVSTLRRMREAGRRFEMTSAPAPA
jgi:hypothetical protein